MRDHLRAFLPGLLVVAVSSCDDMSPPARSPSGLPFYIRRFVDREADVVCWPQTYNAGGGISCLPCRDVAPGVCDVP